MGELQIIAEIGAEYWKVLRALERAVLLAPEPARARLNAQARYSAERLASLMERAGLRVLSFDGMAFEVNLPAVAVNAEDLPSTENLIVERTLEPTVLADSAVILTGKVFVAPNAH